MIGHAAAHRARTPKPWRAAGLILLGTIVASLGADVLSRSSPTEPQPQPQPVAVAVAALPIQTPHPVRPVVTAPIPVQLSIPSIDVDTSLQALNLQSDGSLEVPSQWQVAGWFQGGVRPGSPGPAVIAGHVDSRAGPAVFHRLRELGAGDIVLVTRADGSVVRFVVDDVAQYRKDSFPAATVYGPQPVPVLRLITCTGDFNWSTHNYLDNLVVSAHLA